jgi:hypothetical protein
MICPRCQSDNSDGSQFCINCGHSFNPIPVVTPAAANTEMYFYFGILALVLSLQDFLWRFGYKLFLLIYKNATYSEIYDGIPYKIFIGIFILLNAAVPILIAVKLKNSALKIIIIMIVALYFVMRIFDTYIPWTAWSQFWFTK